MITAIWTALKGSKVVMYAAFALAFVWGLLVLVGKLMGAGRDKERAEQAERLDNLRRQADAIRNDVDTATDADADRLRDKWTRQ